MLQIAVKKSNLVNIALILLHSAALMALWLSAVIPIIKYLLSLLLGVSVYYHLFYHSPRTVVELCYRQGSWLLQYRNGEQYCATLLQPYFVTPHCIILLFKRRKSKPWIRRQRVMLTCDSVDSVSWHQLTLLLRSAL